MNFMKLFVGACVVFLSLAIFAAKGAEKKTFDYDVPAGCDSVTALVTVGKVPEMGIPDRGFRSGDLWVTMAGGKIHKIGFEHFSQWDEHEYVDYGARGPRQKAGTLPAKTPYLQTIMRLNGLGAIYYYSLPKFNMSTGLYDHPDVERFMPEWRKVFLPWETRKIRFEFRTDAKGVVTAWLDGHFAGMLPEKGPVASVKAIVLADCGTATFTSAKRAVDSGNTLALPALPGRANPAFGKDAKIVLDKNVKLPAAFDVWKPEESIDMRRHRQTVDHYRFGWNPIYCRTPWDNGPEYMQWTVPCDFWTEAYVLCAVPVRCGGAPAAEKEVARPLTGGEKEVARSLTGGEGAPRIAAPSGCCAGGYAATQFKHVLGANMTRFGSSVNQSMLIKARMDLGAEGESRKVEGGSADVVRVGWLEYVDAMVPIASEQGRSIPSDAIGTIASTDGGKRNRTIPLYLVRLRLDVGRALDLVNDKPIHTIDRTGKWVGLSRMNEGLGSYLDFEFVGCGTQKWFPRTDVQIFGCLLKKSPYAFDMVQSERGNIFEDDEKPETGVEVIASHDNVKGSIGWKIWSDDWKLLKEGEQKFELAKAGERKVLTFDLAMPEVGWYGLDYEFRNEKGRVLATHEAAFALLGKNDREAGFESPFAAWPQGPCWENGQDGGKWISIGRHNCNPNAEEVQKMMHKLGYHKSWQTPVKSETDCPHPEWKITLSSAHQFSNPPRPKNGKNYGPDEAAKVQAELDKAVAYYREEFSRYPHCEIIQLLHEQGHRDAAQELYTPGTLKPQPYRGLVGDFHVYWCTEFVKRMRKEFPDKKIQVGNGSSSSQMIAKLAANGFDLESVDYLGIESKGFSAMPEFRDNRESPGMLWALRETGRKWGYTNFLMNACNEYVFRPERDIPRDAPAWERMRQADYTLRDFLVSIAWGCTVISSGHLEDSNTDYYDTNWGAGAHCKFFPYSYPKRMFVACATLTKVFDKAKFVRTLDTGHNSFYALEFQRDRQKKDYAYAFWCNKHAAEFVLELAPGTHAVVVDWQGRKRGMRDEGRGMRVNASATPTYVISDKPIKSVKATSVDDDLSVCAGLKRIARFDANDFTFDERKDFTAKMTARATKGPGGMPAVEFVQDTSGPAPSELAFEWARIHLKNNKRFSEDFVWSGTDRIGVWIRGNGSCGKITVGASIGDRSSILYYGFANRNIVEFDGWHFVEMSLPSVFKDRKDQPGRVGGIDLHVYRKALDPKEMVPVKNAFAIGDMYLIRSGDSLRCGGAPAAGKKKESASNLGGEDAAATHDMMKKVEDKDL